MPSLNLNKEIIALFSGQSSMVTTPKLYIELTGNHSLAVVLNQCVFWSNKSDCKDGWFYKEYHEWFEEIHIPERTLRRRFEKLEEHGWITTKVKKVHGLNVKHILPHMDKIIESISSMLSKECPNRPEVQDGAENEQKPCTKVVPTGQSGRSEPAKVADSSIYTDDYTQKKLTNCEESSSSFIFSQTTDRSILNQKVERDTRTDEEFLEEAARHVDHHSDKKYTRLQRANALVKLLKRMKADDVIFYVAGSQPKDPTPEDKKPKLIKLYTEEEEGHLAEYKHYLKVFSTVKTIEEWFPNEEKRAKVLAAVAKEQGIINADKGRVQENLKQARV